MLPVRYNRKCLIGCLFRYQEKRQSEIVLLECLFIDIYNIIKTMLIDAFSPQFRHKYTGHAGRFLSVWLLTQEINQNLRDKIINIYTSEGLCAR